MQNDPVKNNDLLNRTKTFALDVIRFCEKLPNDETCRVLRRQLLRAGTSVGANYRAACRGRSKLDFIAKLGIVSEEADESAFWIELLEAAGKIRREHSEALLAEANELVAIAVSSINTARKNR